MYEIGISGDDVHVQMTLTSPGCPIGGKLVADAGAAVRSVEGVENVKVELVWEPFWTPERIDPRVRALLGD